MKPQIAKRRVRFLMVSPADFMVLFTKGLKVKEGFELVEGAPADAKLINIAADPMRGGVMLVVESSEYEEIPVTKMPPVQMVRIRIP